jgi:hypothetical protein
VFIVIIKTFDTFAVALLLINCFSLLDIQIIAAPMETINGNPDVINFVDNANDAELSG